MKLIKESLNENIEMGPYDGHVVRVEWVDNYGGRASSDFVVIGDWKKPSVMKQMEELTHNGKPPTSIEKIKSYRVIK